MTAVAHVAEMAGSSAGAAVVALHHHLAGRAIARIAPSRSMDIGRPQVFIGPSSFWAPCHDPAAQERQLAERRRIEGVTLPATVEPIDIVAVVRMPHSARFAMLPARAATLGWQPVRWLGLDDLNLVTGTLDIQAARAGAEVAVDIDVTMELRDELRASAAAMSAAICAAIARIALGWALDYARSRVTFGKPIWLHQAIALRLADAEMALNAADALVQAAAVQAERGDLAEAWHTAVSAGNSALDAVLHAMKVGGGHGYLRRNPVEGWLRDLQTVRVCGLSGTGAIDDQ